MNRQNERGLRKLKICGIKDSKTLNFLNKNAVDYFGLIFYERSPRYVDINKAYNLTNIAKHTKTKSVGVFVDLPIKKIQKYIDKLNLKLIQLHGNESDRYIQDIKNNNNIKIIKNIAIRNKKDLELTKKFLNADYLLFDYKSNSINELPGGNAKQFDWEIINNLRIEKKWFLSGGINESNIKNALKLKNPYGFDISSGVEDRPGVKNTDKILKIINIMRKQKNEY